MQDRKIALHWKILIGLALGVVVGVVLNLAWTDATWASFGVNDKTTFLAAKPSDANAEAGAAASAVRFAVNLTQFTGKLFIRCLRFIAVPIVLFSLIAGAASLGDVRKLGRIGGKTLLLFAGATVVSAVIGISLARTVNPGSFVKSETKERLLTERAAEAAGKAATGRAAVAEKNMWDRVLETVPLNPFEAIAKGEMLQIVTFALVLGCALTLVPKTRSAPIIQVCDACADAVTRVVEFLMLTAPYAVFAIIAPIVTTVGLDVLRALGVYSLVVLAGLLSVQFVLYPVMLLVFTHGENRVTPGRFFKAMAPAQLLAFSSSSSNATLPVNMDCCTNRLGVSEEVTSFVLPLGATINMNGTALYLSVVAIFLAQLYDLPLTLGEQTALVVTATLSAIGAAGIPGASIALMVVVLETVHVPPEGIAIILGVDRVLDMCRTVINVSGDAATAAIVASTEGQLRPPGVSGDTAR
ncbi:Proton/glutamate-aspartate symporter [Phycisphaerales bacterium]|nr:Proton/glutamate-aspartate symporter [Phycisphaerales bacterium]